MDQEYVLRERDDEEILRLRFQHCVWRDETNLAIQKAGIQDGDQIIDLGSGPGYMSFDLIHFLENKGTIYCLDNSENFIEFIQQKQYPNVHPIKADLRLEWLQHFNQVGHIDKVFCRWVLMFTGHTEKIIQEIYEMLKPGGKFISIEYFNFKDMTIFPPSAVFDHVFDNVWHLLKKGGGDPDIGGKVYKIMESIGFHHIKLYPIYKTGRANSPVWQWLEQTNVNHQNLVNANLISQDELELFYKDWKTKSSLENSIVSAPPLMITIGEK